MLELFKHKSVRNIQLLCSLLLLGSLYGCGSKDAPTELPHADAVLQLLHAQDASVIQIKLQQCQVGNLFAGQTGTSAKYDIYRCQITVERFDDEYQQSFLKDQVIHLRPYDSETGWQLVASN